MANLSHQDRSGNSRSEGRNRNHRPQRRNLGDVGGMRHVLAPPIRRSGSQAVILARLGSTLLSRLRVVIGHEYQLIVSDSWSDFRLRARRSPIQIAVVDPSVDGADDAATSEGVAAIRSIPRGTAVFVYASLTPAGTRAMLTLSADGVRHFVISGVDDEPTRFRERLEEFRGPGMEEEVLAPVLTALAAAQSPPTVANALRALFRTPRRFESAEDLATFAGVTRQYFNRCLAEAGLVPARIMVVAARVLRAYQYARVPGLTLSDIAARLRYTDTRTLTRHARELTGTTLAVWSAAVSPEECVAQITARLGIGVRRPLVLLSTPKQRPAAGG